MKRIYILALLGMLALTACAAPDKGFTDISTADLQVMLETKDFTLVNVHIPFEGNIPGTDEFVPFNEISQNLGQLPADKDAKIVLYCRSGNMSETAAKELVGLGYTNVFELDGGYNGWKAAGLPFGGY
ncbi:MAG: rhodanese-like domain-containing protein [Anaerolineae bacterium]|nr:rhodanese-like domain-containing protein [Anaerolineae bacterium]